MSTFASKGMTGKVRNARRGGTSLAEGGASSSLTPSYSLNFMSGSLVPVVGTGTPTFTRTADTATYINSAGLIALAPYNILLNSNDLSSGAGWTPVGSVLSAGAVAGPGTAGAPTTLCKLNEVVAVSEHVVVQNATIVAGDTTTGSVYAKAAERNFLVLRLIDSPGFTSSTQVWFNLATGAIGTTTNQGTVTLTSSSIESLGNGYYRCSVTARLDGSSTVARFDIFSATTNGGTTYQGVANSGIYVGGAQVHKGTTVRTYVETTAASNGGPRFEYDPVTLLPLGLLIEDARTNLCLRSQEFDNASWVYGANISVTGINAVVAPDGTTTGDTITITGAGNGVYQTIASLTAAKTYEFSCYVKLGTLAAADFKMAFYNNIAGSFIASDVVPTATPTSTGWTRITYQITTPALCTSIRIYPFRNSSVLTGTFSLWGCQLESNATLGKCGASSYIPTTSAAVVRNMDKCQLATASMSGYAAGDGTMRAVGDSYEPASNVSADNPLASLSDGTGANFIGIFYGNQTTAEGEIVTNDWAEYEGYATTTTITGVRKVAMAWPTNADQSVYNNYGAKGVAWGDNIPVAALPTCTTLSIGQVGAVDNWHLQGHIQEFSYWADQASDALTQNLSA